MILIDGTFHSQAEIDAKGKLVDLPRAPAAAPLS